MTIYDLKPAFQKLLRPLVDALANRGITPNQITWAALLLSIATGSIIVLFPDHLEILYSVPFVLFIRMALNALDGMLATTHHLKSDKGAILNEMGDVVSDAALYLPFALIAGVSGIGMVLFVVVGIWVEMAGVLGEAIGKERRYDGPMGKSDRAFLVGVLALLLAMGITPGLWSDVIVFLGTALGVMTMLRRIKRVV